MLLKIGELAKRTGLTVRTLHHYDAIKLLCPSARSESGYRLYNRQDIERLHRIQALRRLNLSLADIASLLKGGSTDLQTVIEQQIALLDLQAKRTIALRDRLKDLLARVAEKVEPDMSDWLTTLGMMELYDKYFTSDEVATLRVLSEAANRNTTAQSKALITEIRDLMDRNIPPESEEVQALSIPWMQRVHERMGGDARLIKKLDAMHRNESAVQALTGVDGSMMDYMAKASVARRLKSYAKHLDAKEMERVRENLGKYRPQWLAMSAELRTLMDKGVSPLDESAQNLCSRWLSLSNVVWGEDPAVHEKVRAAHGNEPDLLVGTGINSDMLAYLGEGIGHLIRQHAGKKQ